MPGRWLPASDSRLASWRTGWRSALPPLVFHLGLLALVDPARHLLAFLVLMALGWGWLALVAGWRSDGWQPGVALILGVAAVLRVLLLPLPPTLSDDVLRYVWDGKVTMAGQNPYRLAPESPLLTPLRDDLWQQLPHRDVATVYPPLALATFSIAARLPAPVLSLKVGLSLADLLTCCLLIRCCAQLGLARSRVLWYAWNPLVTFEVAGMGHVDSLGAAALVGAVLLLIRRPPRDLGAGVSAAAGVLAKLVPVVALPLFARHARRPLRFLLAGGLLLVLGLGGVVWFTGAVPPGLVRYGVGWDFNGPLFEPLSRLLDRIDAPTAVKATLDELKVLTGKHEHWNRWYPFVYPQLLAKLLLAGLLLAVVARSGWDRSPLVPATGRLMGGALLCTATFYPWYALWVLPLAALCRQRAWLALGGLLPLTYLSQPGPLPLWPGLWAAVWLPFFFLLWRNSGWSTD